MKKRAYSLICAALAALALSCAQPFEPPASAIAEGAGRAVLTVSAGETGGARTVLPAAVPVFSRYEAEFSKDGDTVTVSDTTDITGAGVSRELTAGTWTATVRAYRRFTPTGGTDTEYLAARGSESVSVAAGQVAPVTVSIAPVPVTDTADDGIFTYTVSFPDDVGAVSLTLSGGGTVITETPVSGAKTSLALAPGYYDLRITLSKTVGGAAFTAGASEKAHIYSGLETGAVYEFTGDDFVQTIPFMGTLGLPPGVTFSSGTVAVYDNSGYAGDPVASAAIAAGKTFWAVAVPASHSGETLYLTLDAADSEGTLYTAAGDTGVISGAGDDNVSLTVTGKYVFLSHNTWAAGNITVGGTVDWYSFTAAAAGTCYVQWDDSYNNTMGGGTGDKTLAASVSAYRSDGTTVFSNEAGAYSIPRSVSVSAGETVYVRVAGQFINTGTYAIRYYEPFTVTFDTDGGTSVSSQTVVPGGTVTEPAAPTKTDHLFAGWYKEVALTTLWDFATDTVPGNATLYARWIPFKMVPVPVPGGGIAFPTGTDDSGTATVADAYELGETEVTYELWHTVRSWAESNGYSFFNNPGREGSSATSQNTTPGVNRQEPVTMATWFDAVVWLNALTEWVNAKTGSGLTPVYYYDSGYATVAKNSDYSSNFEKANSSYSYASAYVKPGATGFRLPTSEEWELAARWRGTDTTNTVNNGTFNAAPWFTQGDSASGATADYNDATETNKVAWYYDSTDFPGGTKKTQAVKGKAANTLGLYDMSGNVWEWCFDWYPSYSGSRRIMRGGGWGSGAFYLQVGYVIYDNPGDRGGGGGFRPARTAQ